MSKADFERAAKRVNGLTDAQLGQIDGVEGLWATVPVTVRTSSTTLTEATPGTGGWASAALPRGCKTRKNYREYRNAVNAVVARFSTSKRWCYNGKRVTKAPRVTPHVFIAAWAVNWDYLGVVGSTHRYEGNKSRHRTYKQGKFKVSYAAFSSTKLPWVTTIGYSGGVSTIKGGG